MRLLGFLVGFILVATAFIFFINSDPAAVGKHHSDNALSVIRPEKEDSSVPKPDQLDFVKSDQSRIKPESKTRIPETKGLPIVEPTQEIVFGPIKKIEPISTISVTPSDEETTTDPNAHHDNQPITLKAAKSPTPSETITDANLAENAVRWQPFWGPFNTPGSAKSFTKALEQKTGLDIRIKKTRPGQYTIMYPFTSEDDRQASALLIERKTGLRIEPR